MPVRRIDEQPLVDLPLGAEPPLIPGRVTGHPYQRAGRLVVRRSLDHPDAAERPLIEPYAQLLAHLAGQRRPVVLPGLPFAARQVEPIPRTRPYRQEPSPRYVQPPQYV